MKGMISTKTLADALTAARFCLAGVILWLGIKGGAEALPAAVVTLVLAWVTDVLDGPLARRDPSGRHTWIGDRDLEIDISVGVAVLVYLTLAGYVSLKAAVGYSIVCVVLLWRFRYTWPGVCKRRLTLGYCTLRCATRHGTGWQPWGTCCWSFWRPGRAFRA
jgi:phosphatidylglycerophosphate synthase